MEMVRGSVSKAIQQLMGSAGPSENASAGDLATRGYAMPARTPEQIKEENPELITAPANIAAPSAQELSRVGPQKIGNDVFAALSQVQDPAQQQLGQPIPNQPMPTNLPPARKTTNGLVLPQAQPNQDGDWIL